MFEALLTAVHEREIRPNFFIENTKPDARYVLQEPIIHEKFLLKKFLEFSNHEYLKNLLKLSFDGEILAFVEYFNNLKPSESPYYSQFKLQFYDINQRKFIIQKDQGRDVYIVHYNGFIFGANYPKMIIIREREK